MATNKVVYGSKVLVDLTDTTATPDNVEEGYVFYDSTGAKRTGAYVAQASSNFDLSDRMAKGVDGEGNIVDGAIIEGVVNYPDPNSSDGSTISNVASAMFAHAEGGNTSATNIQAHAEGASTNASGIASHAEGQSTVASGDASHAEGAMTVASGFNSHAEGKGTKASGRSQMVIGEYNAEDASATDVLYRGDYALIIGNGTSDEERSNAFGIKWDGTIVFADGTEITPAEFRKLKEARSTVNTVTLSSSSWTASESDGFVTQEVSVTGMTSDSYPRASIVYPDGITASNKDVIDEASNLLFKMETKEGAVKFYAVSAPSVNLTIQLVEG